LIVLAPDSIQELYDLTMVAFDLADQYRMPVMILGDAMIGQMKEALTPRPYQPLFELPAKDWCVTGKQGRTQGNTVKSLFLADGALEAHNWRLHGRYQELKDREVRCETVDIDDAELILTAFGSAARIAKTAVSMARQAGLKVGLIRPITLFPFPTEVFRQATEHCRRVLCVELNNGQMVEDVRLSVDRQADVRFYGRPGGTGSLPTPEELFEQLQKHYKD
ncbi:MAG: 3-methyl-2-oxobutanoate dehydrogenase subunit beta, partial [Desulfuromonadaceae bacterium]|nr:3-methyl-2-oxobutanoate dehydrogenase subunit beta [Desulfuromonadaceae bacterium]